MDISLLLIILIFLHDKAVLKVLYEKISHKEEE